MAERICRDMGGERNEQARRKDDPKLLVIFH